MEIFIIFWARAGVILAQILNIAWNDRNFAHRYSWVSISITYCKWVLLICFICVKDLTICPSMVTIVYNIKSQFLVDIPSSSMFSFQFIWLIYFCSCTSRFSWDFFWKCFMERFPLGVWLKKEWFKVSKHTIFLFFFYFLFIIIKKNLPSQKNNFATLPSK